MCSKLMKICTVLVILTVCICSLSIKSFAAIDVIEEAEVVSETVKENKGLGGSILDALKKLAEAIIEVIVAIVETIEDAITPKLTGTGDQPTDKPKVPVSKPEEKEEEENPGDENCEHEWELNSSVEATCSAEGKNIYHCSKCPAIKIEKIEKKEHTWVKRANGEFAVANSPCLESQKYYVSCSICKAISSETFAYGGPPGHRYQISYHDKGASGHVEVKTCKVCGDNIVGSQIISHSYSNGICVCGNTKAEEAPKKKKVKLIVLGGFGENANSDNSILTQTVNGVPITEMVDEYEFIPTTRDNTHGNFASETSRQASGRAIRESADDEDCITIVVATSMGGENVYHTDMTGVDVVILADGASSIPGAGQDTPERMAELWEGKVDEMTASGTDVHIFSTDDGRKISESTRQLAERESDNPDVDAEHVGGRHGAVCEGAADEIAEIIIGSQE